MAWYMALRAPLPYGVSKLNSVRSAPVAARRSPLVSAPAMNQNILLFVLSKASMII